MADNRTLDEIIRGFDSLGSVVGMPGLPPGITQMMSGNLPSLTPYIPPLQVPPPYMAMPVSAAPMIDMMQQQMHTQQLVSLQQQQMLAGGAALNVPSPAQMAGGPYGVFQQGLPMPSPQSWAMPNMQMPLLSAALPPLQVQPQFHNAADFGMSRVSEYNRRRAAQDQLNIRGAAKGLVSGAGAWVGGGIGAAIGAASSGVGVGLGANVGSILGSLAGHSDTVNDAVGWAFEPSLRRRAHGMRLREASEGFYTSGASMDASGRGMSATSAADLTRKLGTLTSDSMNSTDIVNMTQMSMQTGLLNMSTNNDQIMKTMGNVIKAVGAIAKMTGDPDVRNAISRIAEMRNMGMDISQAASTVASARVFGRMTGMGAQGVLDQGGMLGAAAFQGSGMTASAGIGAGMLAQGLTQAGIRGGAINAQQLALMGGQQSVSQQVTQALAATMSGSVGHAILASVTRQGTGGNLALDGDALQGLVGGGAVDIKKLISTGARNLTPDMIGKIEMQKGELLDSMSKQLGPMGMLRLLGGVGQGLQGEAGLGSLQQGLHVAMGKQNPQLARAVASMLQTPGVLGGMAQQYDTEASIQTRNASAELAGRRGYFGRRWDKLTDSGAGIFTRDKLGPNLDLSGAREEERARSAAMGEQVVFSDLQGVSGVHNTFGQRGSSRSFDADELYYGDRDLTDRLFDSPREEALRRLQGQSVPGTALNRVLGIENTNYSMDSARRNAGQLGTALQRGLKGPDHINIKLTQDVRKMFKTGTINNIQRIASDEVKSMLESPFGLSPASFGTSLKTRVRARLPASEKLAFDRAIAQNPDLMMSLTQIAAFSDKYGEDLEVFEEGAARVESQSKQALAAVSVASLEEWGERATEASVQAGMSLLGAPGASPFVRSLKRGLNTFSPISAVSDLSDEDFVAADRAVADLRQAFGGDDAMMARFTLEASGDTEGLGALYDQVGNHFTGQRGETYSKAAAALRAKYKDKPDVFRKIHQGQKGSSIDHLRSNLGLRSRDAQQRVADQRFGEVAGFVQLKTGITSGTIQGTAGLVDFVKTHADKDVMKPFAKAIAGQSSSEAWETLSRMAGDPGSFKAYDPSVDGKAADEIKSEQAAVLRAMSTQFNDGTVKFGEAVEMFSKAVNSKKFEQLLETPR